MEEKEGEKRICVFLCWSQSLPRTPQGMTSKRVEGRKKEEKETSLGIFFSVAKKKGTK